MVRHGEQMLPVEDMMWINLGLQQYQTTSVFGSGEMRMSGRSVLQARQTHAGSDKARTGRP